jgi:hypothetical protein
MDSFLLISPYSFLLSILLMLGNFSIGHFFLKNNFLKDIFNDISNSIFQKALIGQIFLILLIFPLIVFFDNARVIIIFFLVLNFVALFFYLFEIFITKKKKFLQFKSQKNKSIYYYVLVLLIILYFLLAASPITDADSLDYHIGSAINILRYDSYVLFKEWFTQAQSGSGETLVAFGLYAGAEQYASLIQFSGLLSICGILLRTSSESKVFKSHFVLPLIILTCPVLLFLGSTAKPQLFFSASLLVALAIIYRNNNKQNSIIAYVLVNIIIFFCMTGKFSFSLSGFLIWILATFRFASEKNILKLFFISTFVCLLVYFPYIYWKWMQYGGNFFLYFLSPFPLHLPGYSNFLEHIRAPQGLGLNFPYFLIVTNSLTRITETLGFSSLIFLYYVFHKKNREMYSIVIISVVYLILSNWYASPNARYFFDILLWLAFGLKYIKVQGNFNFLKIFYLSQVFTVILALLYSTYNLFPGSITQKQYFLVKNKYANDYAAVKWVIEEIGNENVVIFARSISHDGFAISGLFMNFTNSDDSLYYKNLIKEKKVKYYATFGEFPRLEDFDGCIVSIYKFKNNVGNYAVRNPFAKKSSYNGYIYHLDYSKLPTCEK